MAFHIGHKALAALGVGVATVHEAVDKHVGQPVFLCYVAQSEKVLKRTVHAAIRREAHKMNALAGLFRVSERAHYLRIFLYRSVGNGAVNLHQVLIHHSAAAYVQVTHLAVTHLSVGQSHIFATGL